MLTVIDRNGAPRWRACVALSAAVASTAACWVPKETGDIMQRDIRALQEGLQNTGKGLDEQRAQLAEQIELANGQVQRVEKTLQELNRAARMTDADFGVQMEQLRKEMQELRGQIELLNYRQGQIEGRLQGDQSITARIEALESSKPAGAGAGAPKDAGASSGGASADGKVPDDKSGDKSAGKGDAAAAADKAPTDKEGMLKRARELSKAKKFDDAKGMLRQIVQKWPKEPGITDAAYLELGDLYFDEKKYRSALQEYIQVVEKFAKNSLVDRAYYRIGECSLALGNYEDAKIFFGEVVNNYKKSPLAKSARAKLHDIDKRLSTEKKSPKK